MQIGLLSLIKRGKVSRCAATTLRHSFESRCGTFKRVKLNEPKNDLEVSKNLPTKFCAGEFCRKNLNNFRLK